MSEVLYRKYRPQAFSEVVGQDHIVSVFVQALKDQNLSHAYLFSGTRGTGKTSVARILARELGTTDRDLYEIDAASNRGIDDIRALREEVSTLPFESTYKVYIIDEVHMLTKEAFNALLKTLEEPPAHVIFILATTELEKLPDTIRSRCQTFVFTTPSQTTLRTRLEQVLEAEKISIEPTGIELIAYVADGSFRDALGVLQKVVSVATEQTLSTELVAEVLGAPPRTLIQAVVQAVHTGEVDAGLTALQTLNRGSLDTGLAFKLVLERLRAVLLLKNAPQLKPTLLERLGEDEITWLSELASATPSGINARSLQAFLDSYQYKDATSIPSLPLELALLSLTKDE